MIRAVASSGGTLVSLTDGSFFSRFFGSPSASGSVVSTDSALRVATVWRCVNLIASAIATLPINVYQDNAAGGGRVIAKDHPLQFLLHSEPNNEQTAVEFFEFIMLSLLLAGNAYVWKQWNSGVGSSRRILNLIPLVPLRVSVSRQLDNSLNYSYVDFNGNVYNGLTKDDILHIKGPSLDGMMGLSPLSYAREVIGTSIAANAAGAMVFKNGLKASGVLQSDQILTPKQRDDLRSHMQSFGGANAGGVITLEAGFKYQQITMSPADAQLLESQKFNVEEICRWFGVPPHMAGSTSNSTSWGSGLEQQTLGFLTYCLRPWIARIEDAIKRGCFTPAEKAKGYYAEFSVEGLLRTDSAARSAYYSQLTQNGIYTRDEVRRLENMPPMGGNAEVLTVQSALMPLDKLGEATAAAPAKIDQQDPIEETRKV
ncbi:phage portal protein [Pandoraea apista]|uniref:Phage portal protein n=3 Tax=Pseudomonadota TaxID=1224 RepID=A0ABX9ZLH2_9BURK|nr:phage portal protein [Pandoraea apista]RUN81883.1 phage portal protein [Pandoraea apista]